MRIPIATILILFCSLLNQSATASDRTTRVGLQTPSLLNFWQPQPPAARGTRSRSHANTSCLPGNLRAALANVSARFGPITVISTHRPGARIRGGPSLHASCRAVDFRPARGNYSKVATYLRNTWNGGLGTYSSGHIHLDVGSNYRWHSGADDAPSAASSYHGKEQPN